MNTALWIIQGVLAALFGAAGTFKATQPKEKLLKNLPWVEDFSAQQVKLIGLLELLAAIGLIVPQLTGIVTILTPLAAVGLMLTMIGASITHIRRKEFSSIGINAAFLALSAFVAYGRF